MLENYTMGEMNSLFRSRIGIHANEKITFTSLDRVFEKTAETIPFENLCVIENRAFELNKDKLAEKILIKNKGGLCYDLNLLLYYFLIDNGFNAHLTGGPLIIMPPRNINHLGEPM